MTWKKNSAGTDSAEAHYVVRRIARPIRDAMESSLTRTQRLQARERLARTPDRNRPDKDTGRRR